jgi:hypothetical protein
MPALTEIDDDFDPFATAVLTCYLRGKRAADKRAAQKAAQKGGK